MKRVFEHTFQEKNMHKKVGKCTCFCAFFKDMLKFNELKMKRELREDINSRGRRDFNPKLEYSVLFL